MSEVSVFGFDPPSSEAAKIVTGPQRHNVIDGVSVDLRVAEIDSIEWSPRPAWFWHIIPSPEGAGLLFPSHAQFFRRFNPNWAPDDGVFELRAGDFVEVEDWDIFGPDVQFDHPHDLHRYALYLRVIRDGRPNSITQPLSLFGNSELRGTKPAMAFDNLVRRIFASHGIESFPPMTQTLDWRGGDLGVRALSAARTSQVHIDMINASLAGLPHGTRSEIAELIKVACGAASLAAFYQTKQELRCAETAASALAEGRKLAAKNNKKWDRIDLSRRLAAENPEWRRNRIATEVIKQLGLSEAARQPILRMLKREDIGPSTDLQQ